MPDPSIPTSSLLAALAVVAELRWAVARLGNRVAALEDGGPPHRKKKRAATVALWLAAFACLTLGGCASTARSQVLTRTVEHRQGVEAGQAVDVVTTTDTEEHATAEKKTAPDVPASVASPLASALAGLVPGGGAIASVLGLGALWLREKQQHSRTQKSDDEGWSLLLADRNPTPTREAQ